MPHDELDMEWEVPDGGFSVPQSEGGIREALLIWRRNTPELVWNTLAGFENNPGTLPQTETILQGYSVGGLRMDEILQVKRFGDSCRKLGEMILDGSFDLSEKTACGLHAILGQEEALEWGVLRSRGTIGIHLVDYMPPVGAQIPQLARHGFAALRKISNTCERAFVTFLWMSRTQLFYDCNKRTALLMLNGILLSNGYYPFAFLKEDIQNFNECLRTFYNTGNATAMLGYIARVCRKLYVESSARGGRSPSGRPGTVVPGR